MPLPGRFLLYAEAGIDQLEVDSKAAKLKDRFRKMSTEELIQIAKRKLPELASGEKQAQLAERPESSDGNPNSNEGR